MERRDWLDLHGHCTNRYRLSFDYQFFSYGDDWDSPPPMSHEFKMFLQRYARVSIGFLRDFEQLALVWHLQSFMTWFSFGTNYDTARRFGIDFCIEFPIEIVNMGILFQFLQFYPLETKMGMTNFATFDQEKWWYFRQRYEKMIRNEWADAIYRLFLESTGCKRETETDECFSKPTFSSDSTCITPVDDFSHSSHSTSVNDKVLKNERDIHLTAISFASNTAIAPVQLCTRANNSLIEETKPVDTFETMAIRSVDNVSITCQPTPYQNKVDIDDKECGVKNVPQDCTRLPVSTERGDHVETGNRIAPGMVSKWKRFCCHGIDHGRNLSTYPVFATGGCITSTAKVKMKISKTGASPNDPLDLTRDKTTQNSSVWKTGENVATAPKQNMDSKTKARTGAITSHEQSKIGIDVGKDIKEYGRVDVQSTGTDGLYPTVENTTCDIETNADVVSLARQDDMTPGCIKTTECKRMIVEYHNRKIIRHRIPLGIRIEAGKISKPVNAKKICNNRINSAAHISPKAGNLPEDVHKRLIVVKRRGNKSSDDEYTWRACNPILIQCEN